MEIYGTHKARKKFGKILKNAQRDEIPITLLLYKDVACVAAPFTWFKRACRALDTPPTTTPGPETFREQRLQLGELMADVMVNESFITLSRLGWTACVLVPTPWYTRLVALIGLPAGDLPEEPPPIGAPGART